VSAGAKSGGAESTAKDFLAAYGGAFGVPSSRSGYTTSGVSTENGRTYVRLSQTYNGLPVFAASSVVQLNALGISCVYTDIMRDPSMFDSGAVSLSPAMTAEKAKEAAISQIADAEKVSEQSLRAGDAKRYVFDPAVVSREGNPTIAWMTLVQSSDKAIVEVVLIDGHTGTMLYHYPLNHPAQNRKIYDTESIFPPQLNLVRSEGENPCGIIDADNAYDCLGDAYAFYWQHHHRDSYDDQGGTLSATVHYCEPGDCPMANAMWMSPLPPGYEYYYYEQNHIYFGDGYTVDDVAAHELTHGVTDYTSQLLYEDQSGAMNEGFSDIWGEFIDLTNGRGSDTEADRWYMGEDLPDGPGRYMKDPTVFGSPDRVGSRYYYTGTGDNGGVHYNSGVINKLCYLITDGDTFNGYTVEGIGLDKAAKLFYECQAHLLTQSSDFLDLYYALGQATLNLEYTFEERLNIQAAAKAVEIAPLYDTAVLSTFRGIPTYNSYGQPVNAMMWENPASGYFKQVILVRNTDHFPMDPDDGVALYRGRQQSYLDTAVVAGKTYYYTLFADLYIGFPTSLRARVTAGGAVPDFLSEYFYEGQYSFMASKPLDLDFTQITFYPTGAPSAPLGGTASYGDYSQYTATIRRNVYQFPVAREDEHGGAFELPMENDAILNLNLTDPFPFFGVPRRTVCLASNGYISFSMPTWNVQNFPSMASHFSLPRISPLFADLDPLSGGEIWCRFLDDRIVVTWDNVPEWLEGVNPPRISMNSVQAELFYSGQIRFTYLGVDATSAVVGISDGSGTPMDPADVFSNVRSVDMSCDFTSLPTRALMPYMEPVPLMLADAGKEVAFDVKSVMPPGTGVPVLTAEWDGPQPTIPFIDNGNGTGRFQWLTNEADHGDYTLRLLATAGAMQCYEDVFLHIGLTEALPEALNIKMKSGNLVEDPTQDRIINYGSDLEVEYDYYHPLALENVYYQEGATEVSWYKNGQFLNGYWNVRKVPAQAIKPGDTWYCTVTPCTIYGESGPIRGMTRRSPTVTVLALPEILNVVRPEDIPAGFNPDDLPLTDVPVPSGPCEGGTKIVLLGRRLSGTVTVQIGGIDAEEVHVINDSRVEVVTPAHIPSGEANGQPIPEQVVVNSSTGIGRYAEGFIFEAGGTIKNDADVNKDGKVNVLDVQLVIRAVLDETKSSLPVDVNIDGQINAADIQTVVNVVLK
jgi:Zn-dependent metalloprotease